VRIKFNWAGLTRETIAGFIYSLYPNIVGRTLTIQQIHTKLSTQLKKIAPLKIKREFDPKIEQNQIWVGGAYYSDLDQEKTKCIEIVFAYPVVDDTICMTPKRFKSMCLNIADTLLHEMIHMRQYRRRKFKILPDYESTANRTKVRLEQEYLGSSDEIDAYAFNIACEMIDKFKGDYDSIIDYLNENQKGKQRRHNSWRMYLKAFEHDHNHPIVQRVKKKVVRYLPLAYVGKPYRNKDWIDR